MAVLIKGKKRPPTCEWVTKNHDVCRCALLDGNDDCALQYCEEGQTWTEQYANCPLVEVPDEQPEWRRLSRGACAVTHHQIEGDARIFFSGTVYIILDFQL